MKTTREKKRVIRKQLPTTSGITCGTDNPASMNCRYYELEGGEVGTMFVAGKIHEGHVGVMHGGLSSSVLDETMGRSCRAVKVDDGESVHMYVTAELTTKYLKPIMIGEKMFAYGRVDRAEGRRCYTSGEIVDESGEVMAAASGVFVRIVKNKTSLTIDEEYLSSYEKLTDNDPKEL